MNNCPTLSTPKGGQVNYVDKYKAPPFRNNNSYGNTYNSNWRNHPNLSLKQNQGQQQGQHQPAQPTSSSNQIENDISSLKNLMGDFIGDND